MKTLFEIVFVMVLVLLTGCQQESSTIPTPETPAEISPALVESKTVTQPSESAQASQVNQESPSIKVENPVHDFGDLAPDSTNKCQFKFKNVGKGKLLINHIQSTCGCSVPEISKKDYGPGESGVVDVTFHAPAYPGAVTKHLYIVSNDPVNPRAEITVKCNVVVKVVVDPDKIQLALNKENGGMPTITINSVDNIPFAITGFTATGQIATVEFDPKVKKTEHVLNPKVNLDKMQDITTGVIQIKVDHPQTKEASVIFNCLPMYELRPPRIILQNTVPGEVTKREVWIVNNFGQEFEIESIVSKNGYMKAVNQKKEGLNIGLDVEITPPAQQESKRRYITDELNIKIKNGPTLTVRCSGWFKVG